MNKTKSPCKSRPIVVLAIILLAVLAVVSAGCIKSNTSGTLALSLTDAPTNELSDVHVSIKKVEVNHDDQWVVLKDFGSKPYSVNLLDLRFDADLLGQEYLPTGNYTQIRLVVDDSDDSSYVVERSNLDVKIPLKVPSGSESGIKINHNFTIAQGTLVSLLMDANVNPGDDDAFIHRTGNGRYQMKPTGIRVVDRVVSGDAHGVVTDSAGLPITTTDVVVTVSNGSGNVTSTIATRDGSAGPEAGSFALHGLLAGSYTLTFSAEGYQPTTANIEVVASKDTDVGMIKLNNI